jgi:glycosyltransferase involved in cell wall biosynthesis
MPSLELSMIVKNGAATLARCLESARAAVDEIVVADTGSTDASVQIARHYGARVIEVPWEDDFSKARNAALRHGCCDWVLYLDADELLDSAEAKGIAALLADPAVSGYDVRTWDYVSTLSTRMLNQPSRRNPQRIEAARAFPAYVEHTNVRLFRRHPEILFEGRVHEGVADSIKRKRLRIAPANFIIHHLGFAEDGPQERNRKMEFYQQLGRRKLIESPNDALAHYELGLGELEYFHNPRAALQYFTRAIELKADSNILFTYAGICLVRLGQLREGLEVLKRAEELGARDAVHLEARGDAQYHSEDFGEARQSYEAAKAAGSESSVVEGKLAVCEVRLGSSATGLQRIQDAIKREPEFGELYDMLMAAALFAGDRRLAAETAERRLGVGTPSADSFLLTAGIWAQLGEWQRAARAVESGCQRFPEDAKLRSAQAEVNQKLGEP